MWQGVGFPAPNLPITTGTGANFGFGLFLPNSGPLTVPTESGNAAVQIPNNGYAEPTLVTIIQRVDNPFDDDPANPLVVAPFFEIVASNASNRPYLINGLRAIVAICVDDELFPGILSLGNPAIAHIAVQNVDNPVGEPGGFEILDPASTAGLEGFVCNEVIGFNSLFDGGLKGFASAAPGYLRRVATSLVLPTIAEAAASATVGKTGLGGLARSLSPFGVTDRTVVIDYGATGYRYLPSAQFEENTEGGIDSTDFHGTAYDDSGWNTGGAPFGSGPVAPNNCPIQTSNPQQTFWPSAPNSESPSDMLVRKQFFFPATGFVSATISIAIDNDVQVYVNGTEISDGLLVHEGCAEQNSVTFVADGEVLNTGSNLLAIRARDRGGESYLDVKVTLNPESE
jgi:hypothetical protein